MRRARAAFISAVLLVIPFSVAATETQNFRERHNVDFVAVPLISASPSFGNGGGASAMAVFDYAPGSQGLPPSSAAVTGLYADRGSHFAGVFSRLFPSQDWRFKIGAANILVKNQLDIDGYEQRVDFGTTVNVALAEAVYRVFPHGYAGLKAMVKDLSYSADNESGAAYLEAVGAEETASGSFGPVFTYDTRDNPFFPYRGIYGELSLVAYPESLGNSADYFEVEGFLNGYWRMRPKHILAARLYARFTPDDTPYADLSTLGRRADLRGYVSGEQLANHLVDVQLEYRYQFLERWTLVGFIGEAALFDNDGLESDDLYASAGVGIRFMLNQARRVNLRVDVAVGEDDSQGFYIGLSEAF